MYDEKETPRARRPKPISPLLLAAIATEIVSPLTHEPQPSETPNEFDPQRFGNNEKVTLNIDGIGEAHIPLAKLTKYALNPENAPDKAIAFETALGYNLDNVGDLIENIIQNINKYEMKETTDLGYGKRFYVQMKLTGANDKTANVLIAWILDKNTGEFRLTSIYVDKK